MSDTNNIFRKTVQMLNNNKINYLENESNNDNSSNNFKNFLKNN